MIDSSRTSATKLGAMAVCAILIVIAIDAGKLHGWAAIIGFIFALSISIFVLMLGLCASTSAYDRLRRAYYYCKSKDYIGKSLVFPDWLKCRKQAARLVATENEIIKRTKVLANLLDIQLEPDYSKRSFTTIWSGKNGSIRRIEILLASQPFRDVCLIAVSNISEENNPIELNRRKKTTMANKNAFNHIVKEIKATNDVALEE